jgi:hypothetical protein
VVAPGGAVALGVNLQHCKVRHEASGRCAVQVLLTGLKKDAVARADNLGWSAAPLAQPDAPVTQIAWPLACVCRAVRAPGVKCTLLVLTCEPLDGVATVST